jgi:hypothetical protein
LICFRFIRIFIHAFSFFIISPLILQIFIWKAILLHLLFRLSFIAFVRLLFFIIIFVTFIAFVVITLAFGFFYAVIEFISNLVLFVIILIVYFILLMIYLVTFDFIQVYYYDRSILFDYCFFEQFKRFSYFHIYLI